MKFFRNLKAKKILTKNELTIYQNLGSYTIEDFKKKFGIKSPNWTYYSINKKLGMNIHQEMGYVIE